MSPGGLLADSGLAVTEIPRRHFIKFESGDLLNVFNKFSINGDMVGDVTAIIGLKVTSSSEEKYALRLDLEGSEVVIDLSEGAYSGPEALEYIPANGGERIVW